MPKAVKYRNDCRNAKGKEKKESEKRKKEK
jgi:hypothetical protein